MKECITMILVIESHHFTRVIGPPRFLGYFLGSMRTILSQLSKHSGSNACLIYQRLAYH